MKSLLLFLMSVVLCRAMEDSGREVSNRQSSSISRRTRDRDDQSIAIGKKTFSSISELLNYQTRMQKPGGIVYANPYLYRIPSLFKKYPQLKTAIDSEGCTVLQLAVKQSLDTTVKSCIKKGLNIDHQNGKGETALMLAVGSWYNFDNLLKVGADIFLKDAQKQTVLMHAWIGHAHQYAGVLLKKNAHLLSSNDNEEPVIDPALMAWLNEETHNETVLNEKSHYFKGRAPMIMTHIQKRSDDLLISAAHQGAYESAEFLLKHGADPDQERPFFGKIAFYNAKGDSKMIALLTKYSKQIDESLCNFESVI